VSWKLPEVEQREFDRNPLVAVICQLRFDPILKVHDRVPDLQDAIRSRFPGYEESEGLLLEVNEGHPRQRTVREHRFTAKREPTAAVLGDQGVSLEYREYRSREQLLSDADLVFGALDDVFAPVSPRRLGLRCVNVLDRATLEEGLGRKLTWEDLVRSSFLTIPRELEGTEALRFASEVTSDISPGGMTVRYGLLPRPGGAGAQYRLDIDRYAEEDLSVRMANSLLSRFSEDVYRLFRAAAGEALLEWMGER